MSSRYRAGDKVFLDATVRSSSATGSYVTAVVREVIGETEIAVPIEILQHANQQKRELANNVLEFSLDFNDANRTAIGRLIGKRGKASRQECVAWIEESINDKLIEALCR